MNAYILSHNGLGDNITMNGAVNFLLQHYIKIYFLCKKSYEINVQLLYNNSNIITIPIDENNEYNHCKDIIMNVDKTYNDIYISGWCHTSYLSSKITNKNVLNHTKNNINIKYGHIIDFYNVIGLDTSIYVNYFNIQSTTLSNSYYYKIKNYNIIFAHTQGSNRSIDVSKLFESFINDTTYIIICANTNMYSPDHIHYNLSNTYINLPVAHYIDIIKNSKEIHVINSCFSCIVYPLELAGVLKNSVVKIYDI
jgi:hypothetical protein